jgi:hypothetical protein
MGKYLQSIGGPSETVGYSNDEEPVALIVDSKDRGLNARLTVRLSTKP